VYGELIKNATIFPGFKEFMICCNANPTIEVYIISHKTQVGHFSEKNVNLREVAREWLQNQGFFAGGNPYILKENIFFEETRNDKIKRIKNLNCTHFIDDLIEVFDSTLFPSHIKRYLFQGKSSHSIRSFANWTEIKNAFFIE
ncbi:MAG TPA: phosphotransferase enzyme domain protein, partial [Gammaproteobacteria bacterium]|nr:phosphotransferase enzyme domain protein [Gammaproteobacteria bacterium]